MCCRESKKVEQNAIVQLFESVFVDSEGEAEGKLVERLVNELFEKTSEGNIFNFIAFQERIVASICFSRLFYESEQEVFLLSPVAVHSDYQGQGVGQALINHGLNALKGRGVEFVITYGDPGFYRKVGFRSISPAIVRPPFKLSQPEGWLGLSLTDNSIETLFGRFSCVDAFNNPALW